ncbi:MAG TPA: hypothetical protein VG078_02470, partial [Acidimicrobiales bacterium]|nr:hypothetical protein [Acidimicrobiales bacterium]
TPEQVRPRNWEAQIRAPTARDVAPADQRLERPGPEPLEEPAVVVTGPAVAGAAIGEFVGSEDVASDDELLEAPPAEPPVADETFWSGAPAPRAAVVVPPLADTTEVHKRIMSVARATERCARVLSGLAERVDVLDEKLSSQGPVAPAEPAAAPDRTELSLMGDQIGRLAVEVAQTHERVTERFASMEALRSELDELTADVGGVQERLDEVTRLQRAQHAGMSSSPVVQAMQRALGELSGELATVGSRLVGLDARLDELQSLPVRMEDVAARQFHRMVPEMLTVPGDLDGVYRELERIAERMAEREKVVATLLGRVTAAEEAVTGLRQDLDRVIGGLVAAREADADAGAWRTAMERRLAALEAPGSEIERLYLALDRMVAERATTTEPGPGRDEEAGNGAGADALGSDTVADAGGTPLRGALPSGSPHSQRAVEALTAELERIRRSIEVLVHPDARRSSGPRR